MDDKMIIDFINNVEPDMSYGSSDGMTRAMVESAENMALINDFITESTYEVYTEAEDKQSFFAKVKNKVSVYFTLLINLIKKFIAKIKGFFVMVRRKLTAAMAKAVKSVASFLNNRINNHKQKFNAKENIEIYDWDPSALTGLHKIIEDQKIDTNKSYTVEEAKQIVEAMKNSISANIQDDKPQNGLLKTTTVSFDPTKADKFLESYLNKKISEPINSTYNILMKSASEKIKALRDVEKTVVASMKSSSGDEFKANKDKYKGLNVLINGLNSVAYKAAQAVASGVFKYYRKLFSAVKKVLVGFRISNGKETKKETAKTESYNILDQIQ